MIKMANNSGHILYVKVTAADRFCFMVYELERKKEMPLKLKVFENVTVVCVLLSIETEMHWSENELIECLVTRVGV